MAPREHKAMPFKARFRQEIWSVDVRYIEEHSLGFPEPIYLISILENYSRALLASKISRTQNHWDFLEVLFAALSTWGALSMLVSDGGAIFYCNQAMDVYTALSIRKERIEPRQAWQNLVESQFNIARKMADARFARARSWEEVIAIHRHFVHDYNVQRHWAHEARDDGCHSPVEVLGGQTGKMYPPAVLDRILFATCYTRYLDHHGYLRFQNWKLYGERGLAKAPVTVWIYEGSLKVEHQAVTLSQYSVELHDDRKRLQKVGSPHLVETPFRSPQLTLFDLGPDEWLSYWKAPDYAARRKHPPGSNVTQLALFEVPIQEKAVGANESSVAPSPRTHLRVISKRSSDEGE
jgi:putative transposase